MSIEMSIKMSKKNERCLDIIDMKLRFYENKIRNLEIIKEYDENFIEKRYELSLLSAIVGQKFYMMERDKVLTEMAK